MATFKLHPVEPGWPRRWTVEALKLVFDSPLATLLFAACLLAVPLAAASFSFSLLAGIATPGTAHGRALGLGLVVLAMAPLYALMVLGFAGWLARIDAAPGRVTSVETLLRRLSPGELALALVKGLLIAALMMMAHHGSGPPAEAAVPALPALVADLAVIVSLNQLPSLWIEPFVRHLTLETSTSLWRPAAVLALLTAVRRAVPLPAILVLQVMALAPFGLGVAAGSDGIRILALALLVLVQAVGRVAYREVFHGPRQAVRVTSRREVFGHG